MAITRSISKRTKETKAKETIETDPMFPGNDVAYRVTKRASKNKGKQSKKSQEHMGFSMFLVTDFLVKYFQTHGPPNYRVLPDDVNLAAGDEWCNLSDTARAEWAEKYKKILAEGKTLLCLQKEYAPLYGRPSA